ncbi:unnamed protein product [Lactuca saligna]|uniref:Uncharacterized protein n=1 Tax=Lactuca saligna TaxID=75948 RepID=A0AA35Z0R9_LACSI|nr:unnamed protein product [Lactuca saligna]
MVKQRCLRHIAAVIGWPNEQTTTLVVGSCGGPMKTSKAAALAKFLERKSQEPSGLCSINPKLLELAVKNAKETVRASETLNVAGYDLRRPRNGREANQTEEKEEEEEEEEEKTEGVFYF